MINLLPVEQKKYVKQEYRRRLVAAAGLLSFAVFVIMSLFLIPFFLVALSEREVAAQLAVATEEEARVRGEIAALDMQAADVNSRVQILAAHGQARSEASALFKKIIEAKLYEGRGIMIKSLTFDAAQSGSGKISVRGIAADRDAALSFKRALESDGAFALVDLPIGALVSSRDVEFLMSLALAEGKTP